MAAMGQGSSGGEGAAQGQGEGEGQQTQDVASLASQLEGVSGSLEEMRSFLQSNPWAAQQAEEGTQDAGEGELDLSWLDNPGIDQDYERQQVERFSQIADHRAQQIAAPLQKELTSMRHELAAERLGAEFPELKTAEMAEKVAGPNGIARQLAQQLGRPELGADPAFWRVAYMAHKATELANSEGSGDPGAAHLESANGATPGPTEADLVKEIMESGGRGSSVLNGM